MLISSAWRSGSTAFSYSPSYSTATTIFSKYSPQTSQIQFIEKVKKAK